MSRIQDFLKETGVFFLATAEGDKPHIRPLGLSLEEDGKILFGVGDFKNVYKQLKSNPLTEIVACKPDGKWLRLSGEAVFETDEKYEQLALDLMPELRGVYNEESGKRLAMFHLENATAVMSDIMGNAEDISGEL